MGLSGSKNLFTIMSVSIIFGCLIISCCGYILSQVKYKKQRHQMQSSDHRYAPELDEHVFTIEMPHTQPSNNEQSSSYVSDRLPPSYETVEIPVSAETQSNMPSIEKDER